MSSNSHSLFCDACGTKSLEEATFCHKCGASLGIKNQSDTQEPRVETLVLIETEANKGQKVCADCGAANQIYNSACHNCKKTTFLFPQSPTTVAEEIVVAVDGDSKDLTYKPHSSKFGFGLMVLLVVIAASIFYLQNHKSDSSMTASSPYAESGYSTDSTKSPKNSDIQSAESAVTNQALVLETVKQGESCQFAGNQKFKDGYSFTCVKAGRSITNLNAKKLIWKQSSQRKLEWATNTKSRIEILNSLHFGIWHQSDMSDISEFDGEAYISSWPCKIYMANSYEAQIWVWDRQVNGNGYGGTWVPTDTQFWVVNEPNYGPAKCVTYFSLHYGGKRITQ